MCYIFYKPYFSDRTYEELSVALAKFNHSLVATGSLSASLQVSFSHGIFIFFFFFVFLLLLNTKFQKNGTSLLVSITFHFHFNKIHYFINRNLTNFI